MSGNNHREQPDPQVKQIIDRLQEYQQLHKHAQIAAYRQNPASIRVRIIDPDFAGRSRMDREQDVWAVLERLEEETLTEVTVLLLLTPEEAETSFASYEFDHPVPSQL